MSLKDKVLAGAAYLDSILPGWHKLICLQVLDISLCNDCICGQLGWQNFNAMYDYDLDRYGFHAESFEDYQILDKLWKELIVGRREKEQLC